MKIEHDKLSLHNGGAEAPARAAGVAGGAGAGAVAASRADALRLSPELRQVQAAMQAAHEPLPVRADLVARMRELLDRGELGADAVALADALINGAVVLR